MDIVKKPLNAGFFTSGKQGRMLLVGQLVFLLQIITETSYSFGAVFFLQYCDNTLLAGVLIFLGRGLMMRYPDVVNSYKMR
ncbi:hypothetical protein P4909_14880 [Escherichia coli]